MLKEQKRLNPWIKSKQLKKKKKKNPNRFEKEPNKTRDIK